MTSSSSSIVSISSWVLSSKCIFFHQGCLINVSSSLWLARALAATGAEWLVKVYTSLSVASESLGAAATNQEAIYSDWRTFREIGCKKESQTWLPEDWEIQKGASPDINTVVLTLDELVEWGNAN